MRSLLRLSTIALLAAVSMACGDDGTTEPEPTRAMTIVSGNGQTGDAGQPLANPLVVQVTEDGSALAGAAVTWAVTAGGGSLSSTSSTTDGSGQASVTLTLGPTPGANAVSASSTGATGSPLAFTATGEGAPPMAASVTVNDNFFDPTSATVAAGGQVTWTWAGSASHNVTFAAGGPSASPTQTSGTFQATFSTAGTFQYQCTIHGAAMSGEVVVQ